VRVLMKLCTLTLRGGLAALHLSAAEGHVDVVDYLIRHKADVLAKDRFGADALRDAIRGKHNAVQQVLFNAGLFSLSLSLSLSPSLSLSLYISLLNVC